MLYRTVDNWTNLAQMRGVLFFAQRLEELTFAYTLDSYKSPTTSIQGLIYEAASLLKNASNLDMESKHKSINSAKNIIDELNLRIKGNWIAKGICSIKSEDFFLSSYDKLNIDDIVRNLDVLAAELDVEAYIAEIVSGVLALADKSNQKKKIDFLAREFVAFLQNRGVSRDHIHQSVIDFFFSDHRISSPNDLKIFCQLVYPHQHNFIVVFGISSIMSSFDANILADRGIYLLTDTMKGEDIDEMRAHCSGGDYKWLVMVEASATDYTSAVSEALYKIDNLFNFYRIFSHKDEFTTTNFALVEQGCCAGVRKKIDVPKNNMHFIRDMRRVKATSTLKRFHSTITLDVGRDALKFRNIINIHGMSLESKSPDIQLVNLWTCLETISPSTHSGSKISNVVSRVLPVLMLGYYNRILVNLLFDILRWDRHSLARSLKLADIDQSHDLKTKFRSMLVDETHQSALNDLFHRCRDFELLRFRIASVRELLNDCSKARKKLDMHEEMVKWQLHRIYRTRNKIVHAGDSPSFTKYLVENAHDFFDQTLLFCLELSAWKSGFSTFLSCFDYAEAHYRQYKNNLKANNPELIIWTLPRLKDGSFIFSEEVQ